MSLVWSISQSSLNPKDTPPSGSHERYKSQDRLHWEKEFDCNLKMREWILAEKIADEEQLSEIEKEAEIAVKNARNTASANYSQEIKSDQEQALALIGKIINASQHKIELTNIYNDLKENTSPLKLDIVKACTFIIRALGKYEDVNKEDLKNWLENKKK